MGQEHLVTSVADAMAKVGVSRLAHFTPAKNLVHIVRDQLIRSSKDLAENARDYFDPTDLERFDLHPDKLCCSLEFPNGYYLAKARSKKQFVNFPDWVCLLLDASLLERPGTLFSPCNAAKGSGAFLEEGGDALLACYAEVSHPGNFARGAKHRRGVPTDLQAEALIPAPVELSHLLGIVVPSESAAATEAGRLATLGVSAVGLQWVVSPTFFDRNALASSLRFGRDIDEVAWKGVR
jgi:hypothetical protein